VLVVVVVVGAGVWWFFLRDDSPDEADIDTARETLDEGADGAAPDDGDAAEEGAEPAGGVNGTWSVDPTIGSFDYAAEDFSGTWAGYRIQEELASVGGATA